MTFAEFKQLLKEGEEPPQGLSDILQALWHDCQGDWRKAHEIVQNIRTSDASWVHAYLHRKEGDLGNALYWYNRAGRPEAEEELEKEWEQIAQHLLAKETD